MSIKKRVIEYIDLKGISKYKFYQDLGVSNGFLDKDGSIGSDKCEKIYHLYPDVNLIWLLTGDGEMLKTKNQVKKNTTLEVPINTSINASKGDLNTNVNSDVDVAVDKVTEVFKDMIKEKDATILELNKKVWTLEGELETFRTKNIENEALKKKANDFRTRDTLPELPAIPDLPIEPSKVGNITVNQTKYNSESKQMNK